MITHQHYFKMKHAIKTLEKELETQNKLIKVVPENGKVMEMMNQNINDLESAITALKYISKKSHDELNLDNNLKG